MDKDSLFQARVEPPSRPSYPIKMSILWGAFFILLIIIFAVSLIARPPKDFPSGSIYVLESGSSVRRVSNTLEEQGFIRNGRLFEVIVMLCGNKAVIAGDYLFEEPESVLQIATRVTNGDYGDSRKRIILKEGVTVRQISDILQKEFEDFDAENFLRLAKDDEGYLFPDTYFFFPSTDTEEMYRTLRGAFDEAIKDLLPDIAASGKTLHEIITMASIIEREASNDEIERKIVSGILWKRIDIGIPLQVDAPFVYILGKGSAELTRRDLKEDSPYNTYTNKGLPPGPIGNPSRLAIEAALYPSKTDYLFYLHGEDGMVHYALDFDGHRVNKQMYLP